MNSEQETHYDKLLNSFGYKGESIAGGNYALAVMEIEKHIFTPKNLLIVKYILEKLKKEYAIQEGW